MAANGDIKNEYDAQRDVYDDFLGNGIEPEAEYYKYEDADTESLIEYVEEADEIVEDDEMVQQINTHTLSVQQRNITGSIQDVYRCLECGIDFATVEDFTKVHRIIQKKQQLNHRANVAVNKSIVEQNNAHLNEEPTTLKQEAQSSMQLKEEPIVKEPDFADIYDENIQDYSELEEHTAECAKISNDIADLPTMSDELADEAKPTQHTIDISNNEDDDDDGEKYFCCDCQLIFIDLNSAEQHICSALNTSADAEENTTEEIVAEQIAEDTNMLNELEAQKEQMETIKSKTETTDLQYNCLECNKIFNTLQGLQIHTRGHKPQKRKKPAKNNARIIRESDNTTCPVCNTTFGSYKNLKLHMKIHNEQPLRSIEQALPAGAKEQYTDMNKFFCEICNKSFEQHLLGVHKNMHQQTTEYNCGICNKHFENKTSYEMHMQMHADRPSKPRKSQKKPTADNGEDNGKKDGRFPCQYCGRTFQRPYEKVRHERIHTGEKPHACEVCGKCFRVPYSLTLHLRMHTDIRPYVCATCNKRFKSQTVYAHHLRTHAPERPYKCEICSKGFRTSVQLSGHRNTHSKPYNCPVCSRPFASLYYVKVHMKIHNKQNRTGDTTKYSCYICGAVYARIPALRLHMKDLHLVDMDTNEPLQLDDNDCEIINEENSNSLSQQDMKERYDEEEEPAQQIGDVDDDDEEHEVDHEAAVLIAAAAEADCAAYIEAATAQTANATSSTSRMGLHAMRYEVMLGDDELIAENYQTEEVVTDWLAK